MTALHGTKAGVDVSQIIYFLLFIIGIAILSFALKSLLKYLTS